MVRNTGNTVVRMSDLGSAQVVYELPEAPELGERPLMSRYVGAAFSIEDEEVCCQFSDMAMNGACDSKGSIASRETFIIGFPGDFKDTSGDTIQMSYGNVKDNRLIVSFNLPSGIKVSHQIV